MFTFVMQKDIPVISDLVDMKPFKTFFINGSRNNLLKQFETFWRDALLMADILNVNFLTHSVTMLDHKWLLS